MPEPTDNRPTSPGWYWVRPSGDFPWHIAHIVKFRGEFRTRAPQLDVRRQVAIATAARDDTDTEWIGPITPDDLIDRRRVEFLESGPVWQITRWPGTWLIRWLDGAANLKVECPTLREAIDATMAEVEKGNQDDA